MTIFATLANNSTDFALIQEPLVNGQVLSYDKCIGAFVNKTLTPNLFGAVVSAVNLGGVNSLGIFNSIEDGVIKFNSLLPGPGINITLDSNNHLVFTVEASSAQISVPENYEIIINNTGLNTNSVFDIQTVVNTTPIIVSAYCLYPFSASSVYIQNLSGRGQLFSDTIDFSLNGYVSGMAIRISGSSDYDQDLQIDEVITVSSSGEFKSTIYFTTLLSEVSAQVSGEVLISALVIKQYNLYVSDNIVSDYGYDNSRRYDLFFWDLDFGVSGYNIQQNQILLLTGTENNLFDGTYYVEEVLTDVSATGWQGFRFNYLTPLPISANPGFYYDENICNSNLTIQFLQSVVSTGFTVNVSGTVTGNKFINNNLPIENNELTNKFYVDDKIEYEISALRTTDISAINTRLMEIETRLSVLERQKSKPFRYYLQHAKW